MRARSGNVAADPDNLLWGGVVFIAFRSLRRDGRVQLDRQDLDNWVELSKTGV